ncbi:NAD-dependent epimerase/dehydratase family protein [Roseomonas elaeocarpi]|uniref:NAD-dependent epimerase/dehydratase family protein n=1 Tax=Roseomonas elaeocarpi TaxID=907779 RepID=A0ABV6JVR0_9PROT
MPTPSAIPPAARRTGGLPPGTSCVVLGGGGFIGTHLCRRLAADGMRVLGFGRRQSFPEALEGITWLGGDFTDRAALARAVEGAEVVFHLLGGSTPESANIDPVADLGASAVATLHLLEICRAAAVRKLVFVSSGGTVYGIPRATPIPEDAPTDPISAYGISKLAVEKYLYLYRHLHALDYAVLRVANPFGPYQSPTRRQGVVAALMHRMMTAQPVEVWGDGQVVRDFVFVEDVAEALVTVAAHDGPQRVFNVGSGEGRSVNAVIADIAAVLEQPGIVPVHKPARATDVPVSILDIRRIREATGWVPRTPWLAALEATAEWMRHSYR